MKATLIALAAALSLSAGAALANDKNADERIVMDRTPTASIATVECTTERVPGTVDCTIDRKRANTYPVNALDGLNLY